MFEFFVCLGDEMSKCLFEYAEYEKWNPTLRNGLMQFVESLSAVQDYREAQVLLWIL